MSLEKAIEANTAAVLELCGLIKQEIAGNQAVRDVIAGAAEKVAEVAEVVEVAEPVKKTKEKAVETPKKDEPKTEATAGATSTEPSPEAALKYCQDLAMRLFNEKGRDTCMDALSRFGVTKASQMKAEQYPDFITYATGVLAGAPV